IQWPCSCCSQSDHASGTVVCIGLPVIDRNTVDLLAQVSIQVADKGFHDLPLVVLHFRADFSDEEATGSIAPLYPTGVLDMLPTTLLFPLECRVRATELTLRGLQKGFQLRVDSCLGNDLQDFHTTPFFALRSVLWALPQPVPSPAARSAPSRGRLLLPIPACPPGCRGGSAPRVGRRGLQSPHNRLAQKPLAQS